MHVQYIPGGGGGSGQRVSVGRFERYVSEPQTKGNTSSTK